MRWYLTLVKKDSHYFWELEVNNNSYVIRDGQSGTLGTIEIKIFPSYEESLRHAHQLVKEKEQEGYLINPILPFRHADLPLEARSKLQSKLIVNSPRGEFIFSYADKVKVISVVVNDTLSEFEEDDDDTAQGLFFTTAYALVESTPSGASIGMLVWLPSMGKFGSWLADSFELYVFNNVTWKDIELNLPAFLMAEEGTHSLCLAQSILSLKDNFDFIPTHLPDLISEILNTQDPETRGRKAVAFLSSYEKRLTIHPFSIHLESCYTGLGKILYFLGQSWEAKKDYVKAVEYFQKAVPVAIQTPRLHKELLSNLFVQLAHCYMEKGKFELTLKYVDRYELFDSSDKAACDKIRHLLVKRLQVQ